MHIIAPAEAQTETQLRRVLLSEEELYLASISLLHFFLVVNHFLVNTCVSTTTPEESLALYVQKLNPYGLQVLLLSMDWSGQQLHC